MNCDDSGKKGFQNLGSYHVEQSGQEDKTGGRKRSAESATSDEPRSKHSQATAAAQKRDREKRRRGELNETLDDLSELVFEIDPSLMSGRAEVVGMPTDKIAPSTRKNTITNRTELIQCTVRLLTRLHAEGKTKDKIIAELRQGVVHPAQPLPPQPSTVAPQQQLRDPHENGIPCINPASNANPRAAAGRAAAEVGGGYHPSAFFVAQGLPTIAGHQMGHPFLQFVAGPSSSALPSANATPTTSVMIQPQFAGFPHPVGVLQQGLAVNSPLLFGSPRPPSHFAPAQASQEPDTQKQGVHPSCVQSSSVGIQTGSRHNSALAARQQPDQCVVNMGPRESLSSSASQSD